MCWLYDDNFSTEHKSPIATIKQKYQNDWSLEINVLDERDFGIFEIKMHLQLNFHCRFDGNMTKNSPNNIKYCNMDLYKLSYKIDHVAPSICIMDHSIWLVLWELMYQF